MNSTVKTDQRKHAIQMSRFESDAVENFIKSVKAWGGMDNNHLVGRKKELWNVSDAEVMSAIRNGDVIEVHYNNAPEVRAVVRAEIGNRAICVTVSLTNKSVITVWVNTLADNHSGLRMAEYRWNTNLMQVVASLRVPAIAVAR
jgi:hypothetical protein